MRNLNFLKTRGRLLSIAIALTIAGGQTPSARGQEQQPREVSKRLYEYEAKPEGIEFAPFFPAKTPQPSGLYLKKGDRLAIVGDSITEQKMYSRMIENYLTACVPELNVTVRQLGWSGEKTDGFLRRMDRDCLTFQPTIATVCYGMNDARYRPFDVTNGRWYRDHYTDIVQRFKGAGVRVVVGSPGCSGKIAAWVGSKSGTLQEHNLHLCALRDIAMEVAVSEKVPFADIFWPMFQQQILAPKRLGKTGEEFAVAGKDGIHPGWAGQTIMAYAFLNALGVDGQIGEFRIDIHQKKAVTKGMHEVVSFDGKELRLVSKQYPFCASGAIDDDNSIRAGMELVPFHDRLNRLILIIDGVAKDSRLRIGWGKETIEASGEEATAGINLMKRFQNTPFDIAFAAVDAAVLQKQTYETQQIKKEFHGELSKTDFAKVVENTEAIRQPLAEAVARSVVPIDYRIVVEELSSK